MPDDGITDAQIAFPLTLPTLLLIITAKLIISRKFPSLQWRQTGPNTFQSNAEKTMECNSAESYLLNGIPVTKYPHGRAKRRRRTTLTTQSVNDNEWKFTAPLGSGTYPTRQEAMPAIRQMTNAGANDRRKYRS